MESYFNEIRHLANIVDTLHRRFRRLAAHFGPLRLLSARAFVDHRARKNIIWLTIS